MKTKQTNIHTIFYNNLLAHCLKQYKDINKITKAYIINNQVYAIDYISTNGINSIASNTFDAEVVIHVK
jgi:hypothetical protein